MPSSVYPASIQLLRGEGGTASEREGGAVGFVQRGESGCLGSALVGRRGVWGVWWGEGPEREGGGVGFVERGGSGSLGSAQVGRRGVSGVLLGSGSELGLVVYLGDGCV